MSKRTKASSGDRKNRRMRSLVEPAIAELKAGKGLSREQVKRNMTASLGWDYDWFMAQMQMLRAA